MIPCYIIKIIFFLQTNTFQGILATNFVRSFAVFIYMCGDLSYSADTVIGFFSEDGLNATHPASDRWNAMAIACLNYPDNPWVNVVYELTAGKLKELNTKTCDIVLYPSHFSGAAEKVTLWCYVN